MNNKAEIESKIKQVLELYSEIVFVYLFGSFLTSEKFNDIDIALYQTRF